MFHVKWYDSIISSISKRKDETSLIVVSCVCHANHLVTIVPWISSYGNIKRSCSVFLCMKAELLLLQKLHLSITNWETINVHLSYLQSYIFQSVEVHWVLQPQWIMKLASCGTFHDEVIKFDIVFHSFLGRTMK